MAERVRVREITNDEGNRLSRTVRRDSGSVVTWRRAQIVLLSAQGMDASQIARVTFTSADRVRDVIHNFNYDGFDSLRPKYADGRPPSSTPTSGPRSSRTRWPGRPTTLGEPRLHRQHLLGPVQRLDLGFCAPRGAALPNGGERTPSLVAAGWGS